MPRVLTAALAVLGAAQLAGGHTWVEQMRNINDKGEYVGEYGYPRGMVGKTDPGFNGDSMNWLLPQPNEKTNPWIGNGTMLCHQNQRKQQQSSDKYPRLKAVPGKSIAMRYMENGHISLVNDPTNTPKPEKGGTVFVYGTTQPKEDEKLVDVLHWTQDGKGGDARGVLLATNNFDDGRCYEKNSSPLSAERTKDDPNYAVGQTDAGPGTMPLFCETNAAIPKDAKTGQAYTLYWVWQWNTMPGKDPLIPTGKDQYYTTCMDVDVVDTFSQANADAKYALGQQDAMSVAVADWASRTAIYTDALQGEAGPIFGSGAPAPPQSTLATSAAPPFVNSSAPAPTDVPTLTDRPGRPQPSGPPASDNGNVVTEIETVYITVTAPAATAKVAPTPRAEHVARHINGAKFRGRFVRGSR